MIFFQIECDHLKKHGKELEIHSTTELKDKIDKLAMELNDKWSKKLKYEKRDLRFVDFELFICVARIVRRFVKK